MDTPVLQINSTSRPDMDPVDDDVRMTTEVHAKIHGQPGAKSEYILNQYRRGAKIGGGQHGQVYVCYDMSKDGHPKRAMKVVSRKNPRQDRVKELRRNQRIPHSGPHVPITDNLSSTEHKIRKEIAIMKKCRHPNVVRLIEVIDDKLYKKVYMIMEYLGGGEVKWRDDHLRPILRVGQVRRICRDVILGLEYLHQQGVIHRDIKPANLLWTEDRHMVKIADFGVAHISVAHAARGDAHQRTLSSADDLGVLFDDSELCKTAGTPSFLAPEVIYEYGTDLSSTASEASLAGPLQEASKETAGVNRDSTTTVHASQSRPPITKAVDVWAFGVTLYGMLFGHLPYHPPGGNEYALYRMICTEDWEMPETMGFDKIATGKRPPNLSKPTEGSLVVSLLERLLEKDATKRATLAEVKRHPWFLRDISNADSWVQDTLRSPTLSPTDTADHMQSQLASQESYRSDGEYEDMAVQPPDVSQHDYDAAVSQVKFRWDLRSVGKRLSQFFRRRSGRSPAHYTNDDEVGVNSEPSPTMGRHRRRALKNLDHGFARAPQAARSTPRHRKEPSQPMRHQSQQFAKPALTVPSPNRSKSVDRPRASGSGSTTSKAKTFQDPSAASSLVWTQEDPLSAPRSFSPTSTLGGRSKSRFSLSSVRQKWAAGRNASSVFTGGSASGSDMAASSNLFVRSGAKRPPKGLRSSKETSPTGEVPHRLGPASTGHTTPSSPNDAFGIVPAVRAASWGDVGDYGYRDGTRGPEQDVTSVYSGAGDDTPDDDVMLFGAGGVASAPVTPTLATTFVPFSVIDDAGRPVAVQSGHALAFPPELLSPVTGRDPASLPDPGAQSPRAPRPPHARSPLVQAYTSSEDGNSSQRSDDSFDDDDDSSFFERTSDSFDHPGRVGELSSQSNDEEPRATASQIFESDSDTDDEDEGYDGGAAAIEVRRRRPSWAHHENVPPDSDSDE